jgi:hypothetical protein
VKVEVDPDLGDLGQGGLLRAPGASGHVRYYRAGEGSGKGSGNVRTRGGGRWLVKSA